VTDLAQRADQSIAAFARQNVATQATAVETARAIAEVQAAAFVAQQMPRSIQRARADMLEACQQLALAERAFFSFRRSGQSVTGPSIHLARELARVWGNIDYGIKELRRDDSGGESEMLAYAWDLQTNARNSSTFIVPHRRDTKDGQKAITDLRDIYENNANAGARRVREGIFACLPVWFVEEAKATCRATVEHGGGVPLAQRVARVMDYFAGRFGVRKERLEERVGRNADSWDAHDVAGLEVLGRSIHSRETRVEDEFPAADERPTAADVLRKARTPKPASHEPDAEEPPADGTLGIGGDA
jgi:hypothetical protein